MQEAACSAVRRQMGVWGLGNPLAVTGLASPPTTTALPSFSYAPAFQSGGHVRRFLVYWQLKRRLQDMVWG